MVPESNLTHHVLHGNTSPGGPWLLLIFLDLGPIGLYWRLPRHLFVLIFVDPQASKENWRLLETSLQDCQISLYSRVSP